MPAWIGRLARARLQVSSTSAMVTVASILWLAWSANATVGPQCSAETAAIANWRVRLTDSQGGEPEARTHLVALTVDSRRLRWSHVAHSANLRRGSDWNEVHVANGSGDAWVRFRGAHVVLTGWAVGSVDTVLLERNGAAVQAVSLAARPDDYSPHDSTERFYREFSFEAPARSAPAYSLPAFLILFAGLALIVAPWRQGRSAEAWIFLHTASAMLFVWLSQAVITQDDSYSYVSGIRGLLTDPGPLLQPPGYPVLLMLARFVPGLETGNAIGAIQMVLLAASSVWFYRIARRFLPGPAAMFTALLVFSSPCYVSTSRAVLSEAAAVTACIACLYVSLRAHETGSKLLMALAGLLGGAATVIRLASVFLLLPTILALCAFWRPRQHWRSLLTFAGCLTTVIMLPMLWFQLHGRGFALTRQGGGHAYNRVVWAQGQAESSASSIRELRRLLPETASVRRPHWEVYDEVRNRGVSMDSAYDVMSRAAFEGIRSAPGRFAAFSLREAFRLLFTSTRLVPFVGSDVAVPEIENAAMLGFSSSAGAWLDAAMDVQDALWPLIAGLALLAGVVALFRRRVAPLIASLVIGIACYLFGVASTEFADARYVIPVAGFITLVAAWGVSSLTSMPWGHRETPLRTTRSGSSGEVPTSTSRESRHAPGPP